MTREQEAIAKTAEKKFKGGKHRWSLTARLRLMIGCIIFIISISFLISVYYFARKERMDSAVRESENLVNSVSNGIQTDIQGYKELSRLIMVEDRVVKFLRAERSEIDRDMINDSRNGIFDILNVTENVDCVFVFREDGQHLATNRAAYIFDYDRMAEDEWTADIRAHLGRATISINANNTIFKENGKAVITIGRAIYDLLSQQRTGVLLMNISSAVLVKEILATKNDSVCILSQDRQYLAGDISLMKYYDTDYASEKIVHKTREDMGGVPVLISGCRVEGMPLIILHSRPLGSGNVPFEAGYVLTVLLLTIVIAAFVAGAFISRNITGPVFELTHAMEKNREEGKLERVNVVSVQNEIALMEDGYNNMIDHVNDLIKRLIEKEKTLQKAEMRVLHEQIKPHFLYNSLETIGFLAMDAGADDVHAALETLGSFYRNFLSKGDREIPLKREICIVQDYLSLQKLRYGDILNDEYDIAEDTKECIIPKLILQPLVENSIYHGIRLKGEEGTIKITSRLKDGILHVYVRDTGVGMSQEQIDKVLLKREGDEGEVSSDPAESFGLRGTIERIRYFCDDEDVVKIRSEEGEYTEVEFIIPQGLTKEARREATMERILQASRESSKVQGRTERKKPRGEARKNKRLAREQARRKDKDKVI